jgi:hypothetical protein
MSLKKHLRDHFDVLEEASSELRVAAGELSDNCDAIDVVLKLVSEHLDDEEVLARVVSMLTEVQERLGDSQVELGDWSTSLDPGSDR